MHMAPITRTRTRIAPTPSGYLHRGNAFNFLLCWLSAKAKGAEVWLRIDDVDAQRSRPEYVEDVFATLDWLGIQPDGGPSGPDDFYQHHSQQLRMDGYRAALQQLLDQGDAYACTCSRAQIREASEDGLYPGTCREKLQKAVAGEEFAERARLGEEAATLSFHERGKKVPAPDLRELMGDFVLWRKEEVAAYQLASVLDDVAMGIDFIVRGEDLLDSTAAQIWLAGRLGLDAFLDTAFLHHGLLLGTDAQKLSKSLGADALKSQREQGVPVREIYKDFARWQGWKKEADSLPGLLELYQEAATLRS